MSITQSAPPRVLVADDQPDVLEALRLLLDREGFETTTVSSPEAVLGALDRHRFDVLLMDLNYTRDTTSGQEGLDLLTRIHRQHRSLPVVVMTGWGSVDVAVEATREGVRDFVQKPWDNGRLVATLAREAESGRLQRQEDRELAEARAVQRRMLPESFPALTGWQIDGAWYPASSTGVAGDFFDAVGFDATCAGIAIADVMGKGIPAALVMSNLQAAVRAFASPDMRPRDLCAHVNQVLCPNLHNGRFVSFFYGILDTAQGTFTYSNAGHPPPLLVRADGQVERLESSGLVLGVSPQFAYPQNRVGVCRGDRLVLYTDGVTEAGLDTGEEFGEDRLARLVAEARTQDAGAITARVVDAVRGFGGGAQDDMTLIVMACTG
jgi:sigma-B regulation protein RsbU (phosphoserine phosphatase)